VTILKIIYKNPALVGILFILSFLLKLPRERGWKSKISTKGIFFINVSFLRIFLDISNIFITFPRNIILRIYNF